MKLAVICDTHYENTLRVLQKNHTVLAKIACKIGKKCCGEFPNFYAEFCRFYWTHKNKLTAWTYASSKQSDEGESHVKWSLL